MKVHLISTPDVHPQLMNEVLEILKTVSGPLEFSILKMNWSKEDLYAVNQHRFRSDFRFKIDSEYKKQKYDARRGYPLSWRELFFLCEKTRIAKDLEDEDFVVLITNRRNSLNFFSMFDNNGDRNSFVQASDWDYFIDSPAAFPVAYEVLADILRILMKLELNDAEQDFFHKNPIGCFNDYCNNKREIILKLRTADICENCLKCMKNEGVDEQIIIQVLQIFEKIRVSLKFSQGFVGSIRPKAIKVNAKGEIFLDGMEISLTPLEKTIFIFFLKHSEGVRIAELSDYEEEIFGIYKKLKINPDPAIIKNLVNIIDGNFNYNKSRLNANLRKKIGEPLANFYLISGVPGEEFRIPIPCDKVSLDQSF